MSKPKVYFLLDAVLALYAVGPSDDALVSAPIWFGAAAESLSLEESFIGERIASTGDYYKELMQTDEEHSIEIERVWGLQRPEITDWKPGLNQRYALEILWMEETPVTKQASWFKRTYFGVKLQSMRTGSRGVHEFGRRQMFSAERYEVASEAESYLGSAVVGTLGSEYPVPFVKSGQVIAADAVERYLSGYYRWGGNLEILGASVIGRAGQGDPTVFQMEVNGSLVAGTEVSMPAGAANEETEGSEEFEGITVAAGATVRWRAISGPASAGDCAWDLGLTMNVRQI